MRPTDRLEYVWLVDLNAVYGILNDHQVNHKIWRVVILRRCSRPTLVISGRWTTSYTWWETRPWRVCVCQDVVDTQSCREVKKKKQLRVGRRPGRKLKGGVQSSRMSWIAMITTAAATTTRMTTTRRRCSRSRSTAGGCNWQVVKATRPPPPMTRSLKGQRQVGHSGPSPQGQQRQVSWLPEVVDAAPLPDAVVQQALLRRSCSIVFESIWNKSGCTSSFHSVQQICLKSYSCLIWHSVWWMKE